MGWAGSGAFRAANQTLIRSIWVFLAGGRCVAKITAKACWIFLDFLGFSRPDPAFSIGYTEFSAKKFSARFFPCAGGFRRRNSLLARGRAGLLIGPSLTLILISCNQLSSIALGAIGNRRRLILAAARESRLKSPAEGPRSDRARWAPPSRWRDPPLSDGSRRSTGSAFC